MPRPLFRFPAREAGNFCTRRTSRRKTENQYRTAKQFIVAWPLKSTVTAIKKTYTAPRIAFDSDALTIGRQVTMPSTQNLYPQQRIGYT
jgi:hypothetical protein